MADLDTDQLLEFRDVWIRDRYEVVPAVEAVDADPDADPPVEAVEAVDSYLIAYSEFNRTRQQNFFSDAQINSISSSVESDWEEELAALWQEKFNERVDQADDDDTATTKADTQKAEAKYRLMRVVCREQMMEDPAFRQSLMTIGGVDALQPLFDKWILRNNADLTWVRSRSGIYNRIEVERG